MTRRSEAGDTLVEVMVAIAIMAIAVVALMEGLATASSTSGFNRRLTEVQTYLGNAGASLTDPNRNPWQNCATASSYNPSNGVTYTGLWSSAQVKIIQVQYFYINSLGQPAWNSTCWPATYPYTLQLITIMVVAPGGTPGAICPTTTACQTRSFVKGPEE